MGETSYSIEFAKSGRAKCKKCKESINKGDIRIGVMVTGGDFDVQSWYHPECFNLPRKLVKSGVQAEDFVNEMLEDSTGGDILPSKTDEIIEAIASSAGSNGKTKSKTAEGNDVTMVSKIADFVTAHKDMDKENKKKRKNRDDDDQEVPTKKLKGSSSKEDQKIFDLVGKYYKCTVEELKEIIRYNRQVLMGNKEFLIYKIIDGEINKGRLARCVMCGGKLKIKGPSPNECETVTCTGSFDEDTQQRINCDFSCPIAKAPRYQPWYTEEPTEEEKEEMDKLEAEAKGEEVGGGAGTGTGSSDAADNKYVKKLKKAADNLDWDLSNKKKIKSVTASLVDLFMQYNGSSKTKNFKIDLPDDEARLRMDVGTTIVSNRDKKPNEIVSMVISKYGFVKAKMEKAAKKEAAIESMCECPANAALAKAFQELGELYFKEGNRNAGGTYMKVVTVIKNLNFEITEDNALGLGKGKTKVAGIGKGSSEKMHEFVTTGTIEKLEEKRADAA